MAFGKPDLSHIDHETAIAILADICSILWNKGDSANPEWDPGKDLGSDDIGELCLLLDREDIRPSVSGENDK